MENTRDAIIKSIKSIKDNDNEIKGNIEMKLVLSKYSAKKTSSYLLFNNNIQIKKKDKYIFKYECYQCKAIHMIGTTQMLRRINRATSYCYLCRNENPIKRAQQKLLMSNHNTNSNSRIIKDEVKPTYNDIMNESLRLFSELDTTAHAIYYSKHLTHDEYNILAKKIHSFGNNKYMNISDYIYYPVYRSMNQMLFTSVFYDKVNDSIFKAHQPILKCDSCNSLFRAKSIERFKNCIKVLCKDCTFTSKTFTSKTFKIRTVKNINNSIILFQSRLEEKFINWCNNNNILCINGPKIKYIFNNTEHTYRVDFAISDNLIEIKDNHIWHINDVKSGKWKSKEDAIMSFIKIPDNNYKNFYLMTPSNWSQLTNKLIKYSLNSYENMRSDGLKTLT